MKPEKLPLQSADGSQLNLDALYQIAPSCFTEARGADGKVRRVVNFDVLRQLLGDASADTGEEFYQFTWPGKAEARREAARPIRKTLRPVPEDSVDWNTTQNLYIEGDNLEVLKLLQKSYMGKVKMIYIDPPYNTGNDFIYNDNFAKASEDHDREQGDTDEFGNRYRKNLDTKGRFHSDWCSMIYSRLLIARSLLTENGVIFISIGVEELDNLKKICNEIFGADNFIEVFSWVKTSTPPSLLATKSRKTNEYILCYEKNKSGIKYNGVALDGGDAPLLNTGNVFTILKFPKDKVFFKTNKFPNGIYKAHCKDRVKLVDDIEIVDGYSTSDFRLKGEFKWTQDFLESEIANGTTFIIKSDEFSIRFVRAGEGFKRPTNFIKDSIITPIIDKPSNGVGTNENASSHLNSLMDNMDVFSYPKPVSLIKYLTNFIIEDGDIILDFFSGSATTAESTMEYCLENVDKSKLKFILVQLPENLDEMLPKADSVSRVVIENGIRFLNRYKMPHFLTELAKERIRRAGRKIKEGAGLQGQDLDTGFRVFRVDESNMEDVYFQPAALSQDKLDLFLDNVKPDRTDLDLLFGAMLDWGVQLSLPMSKASIDGCDVYTVNDGDLVACFADNITENIISHIADQSPLRVLFRDSCFSSDADKINIFEQFKQRLGWSDEEAMKNIRVI